MNAETCRFELSKLTGATGADKPTYWVLTRNDAGYTTCMNTSSRPLALFSATASSSFTVSLPLMTGMLMPALSAARESARAVSCVSNQKQLALTLMMYASDNNGFFPEQDGAAGFNKLLASELITPTSNILICQSDKTAKPLVKGDLTEANTSYCFLGGGINPDTLKNPSDFPVIVEKPYIVHGKKRQLSVAFADGHCELRQIRDTSSISKIIENIIIYGNLDDEEKNLIRRKALEADKRLGIEP